MILSQFAPAAFDAAALAPVAALIPPRIKEMPMRPAAQGAGVYREPDEIRLTPAEAARLLPAGPEIHVIAGPDRERWSPQHVRAALYAAACIRLSFAARTSGFGLCLDRHGAESLLVETDREAVLRWLAAQADRLMGE